MCMCVSLNVMIMDDSSDIFAIQGFLCKSMKIVYEVRYFCFFFHFVIQMCAYDKCFFFHSL